MAGRQPAPRGPLTLALDVGTSSLRTALFDAAGRRLAGSTAQQGYSLQVDAGGRAEIAPRALLAAARSCLDASHAWLAAQASPPALAAAGSTCFWHSVIGCDARGQPLTPVITWADTRAAGEAHRLRQQLDERDYHARTGCMLHASFWPARQRWLLAADGGLQRSVRWWLSPGEWLLWRLIGLRRCAHGMATGTGLYDPAALDWDDTVLALAGLRREQLQTIDDTPALPAATARRRWPLFAAAPWYPAIGDGAASNLGCGATDSSTMALNFGTSAALRVLRQERRPRAPFGLFAYRIDTQRYLLGGATSNAGNLRQWALANLRLEMDESSLDRHLARRSPGSHGLDVLPFLNGERAPYWRDDLCGLVSGLTLATSALDLLAALTEATHHRLAIIAGHLPGAARRVAIVGGGLTRSTAALRLLADVSGLRLRASRETEATLRGAAVFAMQASGLPVRGPQLGPLIEPDADRARAFARLRRRQLALEASLPATRSGTAGG